MSEVIPTEKAHTRADVIEYLEQQPPHVERRGPWAASGPVGRDSAGYSVLKAAAFALGYIGPEQAKEEVHVHQQLRELYQGYGFVPHCGHQAFLVPLASAHLPAFEPRGQKLRDEGRQKMTAALGRFDPDEAEWILRRTGVRTKALGTISDIAGGSLVPFPALGE